MKPILEVRNIWKEYRIGGKQQRYLSFRDSLAGMVRAKPKPEKFWALQDVSFDVQAGESVGIIGRNGAGKSTLLKILSRITPPTRGRITARGRVASLLEVGTGFHPELTGRENIYLNGSILGLRRVEINSKFDEIVDFSGVERFLDTPLKHYSSGMQLRLAFSVAAHLEPEILLIDEVLAVGDAEFQKKCLGKMDEVSKSGRTVLFVSHNMGAVESLCSRGILILDGKIYREGGTKGIINDYLSLFSLATKDQINHLIGKKIFQSITIREISFTVRERVFAFDLKLESCEFHLISSFIFPIFDLHGERISLIDLRNDFFSVIKNQHSGLLLINITLNMEYYVEGIYFTILNFEYKNSWYESERIYFNLNTQSFEGLRYENEARGVIETPFKAIIAFEN